VKTVKSLNPGAAVRTHYVDVPVGGLAGVSGWDLKTDHWFYRLLQSAQDLINPSSLISCNVL
jgi:hypothetical protein